MKLLCTQENLRRAIGIVERVVGRQGSLPILGNILLETQQGRLKLSATNLEIGVVAWVGAKIDIEGSVTIPAKIFSQFIGNLPVSDVITIESDGQNVSLSSGSYKAKIKGMSSSEFPIIPKKKSNSSIIVPAQGFKVALSRLLPCVSAHETRLELTGVNFLFSEKELVLASTDSFRLSEEIVALEKPIENAVLECVTHAGSLILPAATLNEVSRSIAPNQRVFSITFEENQVFFELEGVEIISRLIVGKFPDYQQIIPQEFSFSAFLLKEEFSRAIRIASVFSLGEVAIELRPEEGVVVVEAVSSSVGEQCAEVMSTSMRGVGRLRTIFSAKALLDGVGFLETSTVVFLANTSGTPVAMRMTDGEIIQQQFTYIMMPLQK